MLTQVEAAAQSIVAALVSILIAVGSIANVVYVPPGIPYYFNSSTGSDANDCKAKACLTIAKAMSLTYNPGDSILFAGTFTGNVTMNPTTVPSRGDGKKPITIGSIDPANRATITAASGGDTGIVQISGISGVTVTDLILRAPQPPALATMPRAGVMIQNPGSSPMSNITVKNSDIAGIAYYAAGRGDWGAEIMIEGWPSGGGSISKLLFLNNDLHGLSGVNSPDDCGICGFGGQPITDVTVRGNRIWNIGGGPPNLAYNKAFQPMGNGIQANGWVGFLIERNIIKDIAANYFGCGGPAGILTANVDTGIIQYNDVSNVQPVPWNGSCDFISYDADLRTRNTIWQYNSSRNAFNSGYYMYDPDGVNWGENTFRYNISERDAVAGYFGFGSISISVVGAPKVYVYGNTVFNDRVYTGRPYENPNQGGYGLSLFGNVGGLIANNLFMVSANISWDGIPAGGGCAGFNARQSTAGWAPTVEIRNNHWHCLNATWWENWWAMNPYSDFAAMATATGKFQSTTTGNPMITAGGAGPNGYVLQRLSPMIGTGMNYSTIAPSPPTTDYFGNAIPTTAGYNRGADGAAHP